MDWRGQTGVLVARCRSGAGGAGAGTMVHTRSRSQHERRTQRRPTDACRSAMPGLPVEAGLHRRGAADQPWARCPVPGCAAEFAARLRKPSAITADDPRCVPRKNVPKSVSKSEQSGSRQNPNLSYEKQNDCEDRQILRPSIVYVYRVPYAQPR